LRQVFRSSSVCWILNLAWHVSDWCLIGWTVFVRPDTFVDLLTPLALILSGFMLRDVWTVLSTRILPRLRMNRFLPWAGLIISVLILFSVLTRYPIAIWSVDNYAESPVSLALLASQGQSFAPPHAAFEMIHPALALLGLLIGSFLAAFSLFSLGTSLTA
jgi:hypothetical protein